MAAETPPTVEVVRRGGAVFAADHLDIRLADGKPVIAAEHVVFPAGARVLVTGPSGAGKSTLFRAIAGIWPFGSGRVTVPADAKVMLVPQRPYFPLAPLATAVAFPAESGTFDDARVAEAIIAVGMPQLVGRLDEEAHWSHVLSLGEQQRLAVARALLHEPDYLFLDEATASLDEAAEAALYRLLQDRLGARPSFPSAIVRRSARSMAAASNWCRTGLSIACARFRWSRRQSDRTRPTAAAPQGGSSQPRFQSRAVARVSGMSIAT